MIITPFKISPIAAKGSLDDGSILYSGDKYYPVMSMACSNPAAVNIGVRDSNSDALVTIASVGTIFPLPDFPSPSFQPQMRDPLVLYSKNKDLTQLALPNAPVSFNTEDLPSTLTNLVAELNTNISGDIANIPAGCVFISSAGNTMTGDLGDFLGSPVGFHIADNNTINAYTNTITFPIPVCQTFILDGSAGGSGLSAGEIDQLLIDIDAQVFVPVPPATITIKSAVATRTAASNAAVVSLTGKGFTVTAP